MKAIMYHYVRPHADEMPWFKYLHLDNFRKQLDWFAENLGFVSRNEFEQSLADKRIANGGAVLTFDDAFTDHIDFVLPELLSRKLWGIFYVPTAAVRAQRPLDVHLLHLLLGTFGGTRALETLVEVLDDDMLDDAWRDDFRKRTYISSDDDTATMEFKRILNYYISYKHQSAVVSEVSKRLTGDNSPPPRIYMTPSQIRALHDAGMVIGAHTVNHVVLSKLSADEQRKEISGSFDDIAAIIGEPVKTFCYPYGGFHTFTNETRTILTSLGCKFAFNVEPRDVEESDLSDCMALPRYDCNAFPYGKAGLI